MFVNTLLNVKSSEKTRLSTSPPRSRDSSLRLVLEEESSTELMLRTDTRTPRKPPRNTRNSFLNSPRNREPRRFLRLPLLLLLQHQLLQRKPQLHQPRLPPKLRSLKNKRMQPRLLPQRSLLPQPKPPQLRSLLQPRPPPLPQLSPPPQPRLLLQQKKPRKNEQVIDRPSSWCLDVE